MGAIIEYPLRGDLSLVFRELAQSRGIRYEEGSLNKKINEYFPGLNNGAITFPHMMLGVQGKLTLCYLGSDPTGVVEIIGAKDSQRMIFANNHNKVTVYDRAIVNALGKINHPYALSMARKATIDNLSVSNDELKQFLDSLLER